MRRNFKQNRLKNATVPLQTSRSDTFSGLKSKEIYKNINFLEQQCRFMDFIHCFIHETKSNPSFLRHSRPVFMGQC